MKDKKSYSYVDLFAGCGGLSLGLEASGAELVFAVEQSDMAGETFFRNFVEPRKPSLDWEVHKNSPLGAQIKNGLAISDIREVIPQLAKMNSHIGADLDLVAGGPPCQGFSLAGRRISSDKRNTLPLEFLKVVSKIAPKFVVIENVVGMSHKFSNEDELSPFESLAISLSRLKVKKMDQSLSYLVQRVRANAAHYGAAQNRERMLLIAVRSDIAEKLKISVTNDTWHSHFHSKGSNLPDLAPVPTTSKNHTKTVRDALSDFIEGEDSEYTSVLKDSRFWKLKAIAGTPNHVLRKHNSETITKFALMHLIRDLNLSPLLLKTKLSPREELLVQDARKKLDVLKYPIRLKDGETTLPNSKDFIKYLEKHKTAKHSQRVIAIDVPAPTIVTAADDYIHPIEPRAMSVRELARFQGFPDMFTFHAKETTGGLKRRTEVPQYSQVGNAVSPFMGLAIGKLIEKWVTKL